MTDQDYWIQGNISSVKESSIGGAVFQQ